MRRRITVSIAYTVLILAGYYVSALRLVHGAEELWKNCSTPRTQYVLQVPGSLAPATGEAATQCSYHTEDGEFTVEAMEQTEAPGPNQSIDARMQKEISMMGGTVTDQEKGDNWFAISGVTSDGTQFFRKHFTNGSQWVTLRITYPHTKHKQYDKWVKRIEKNFVPFSKQEATASPR